MFFISVNKFYNKSLKITLLKFCPKLTQGVELKSIAFCSCEYTLETLTQNEKDTSLPSWPCPRDAASGIAVVLGDGVLFLFLIV